MKENKRLLITIGLVCLAAVLALVGYFAWINIAFVDTLHAEIKSDVAKVRFPAGGLVEDLLVEAGNAVAPDDIVALVRVVDVASGRRLLLPVRAPRGGVVADLGVKEGDALSPAQSLMTIVDPESVWIEAQVNEGRISQVRVGQSVRIRMRQRAVQRTLAGRVAEIGERTSALAQGSISPFGGPAVEIPIKIDISTEGYRLYHGMSADVRIRITPRIW